MRINGTICRRFGVAAATVRNSNISEKFLHRQGMVVTLSVSIRTSTHIYTNVE